MKRLAVVLTALFFGLGGMTALGSYATVNLSPFGAAYGSFLAPAPCCPGFFVQGEYFIGETLEFGQIALLCGGDLVEGLRLAGGLVAFGDSAGGMLGLYLRQDPVMFRGQVAGSILSVDPSWNAELYFSVRFPYVGGGFRYKDVRVCSREFQHLDLWINGYFICCCMPCDPREPVADWPIPMIGMEVNFVEDLSVLYLGASWRPIEYLELKGKLYLARGLDLIPLGFAVDLILP